MSKHATIWICEVKFGKTWYACPFVACDDKLSLAKARARLYVKKSGAIWATKDNKLNSESVRFRKYVSEKPL